MGNGESSSLYDKLDSEIGEEEYWKRAREYDLRNIYYCKEVLSGFAKSKTGGASSSGLFNHDYLLLELSNDTGEYRRHPREFYYNLCSQNSPSPYNTKYLVAEKRSSPEKGIILSWRDIGDPEDHALILRALQHAPRFPCHIGPPLGLHAVRHILRDHNCSYGFFRRNCWYYAQAMAWNLLTECIRTCDDEYERDGLKEKLITLFDDLDDPSWFCIGAAMDLKGGYFARKRGYYGADDA